MIMLLDLRSRGHGFDCRVVVLSLNDWQVVNTYRIDLPLSKQYNLVLTKGR